MSKVILLIGGARSGKSNYAQELAAKTGKLALFVATAEAGDEEMRRRIEAHRRARPAGWRTLEAPVRVGRRIQQEIGASDTVVIDCITLLINNVLAKYSDASGENVDATKAAKAVLDETRQLVECIDRIDARFIIVTNEVGLGLVPANAMSRLYRDLLGKANQALAARADEVYFMVAGIPLTVKAKV